jgi:hypothetical protein
MYIHDDADMETVVKETVEAIREGARHIGKADRAISATQIAEVETAIKLLQGMLDLKRH